MITNKHYFVTMIPMIETLMVATAAQLTIVNFDIIVGLYKKITCI
jgi:hypothetical protein